MGETRYSEWILWRVRVNWYMTLPLKTTAPAAVKADLSADTRSTAAKLETC